EFKGVNKQAVALIDGEVVFWQRTRVFHIPKALFDFSSLVPQLHAEDTDVSAGPALLIRNVVFGQVVNRYILLRLWGRGGRTCALRRRVRLFFFIAAASG